MTPHDFSNRTLDGRYALIRRIGHGGMATVYEATDHQLDKRVAIKVLNPEFTHDDDHMARFRQEARSAAKIRHPHLVDVTDQGYTRDGLAYFVMEFLEGESLGEHIHRNKGPMPWAMVVEIVAQVCDALEVAHERGIIHRDIKPGNCFLERRRGTGQVLFVKVLDLGIAKVRREERDAIAPPSTRESQGVPGTPEYMAPELVRGEPYDRRVDIYSLGIMMYRLLTGQLPFTSASPFTTLEMQCNRDPTPPRELVPGIPERIEHVVLTALHKPPEARWGGAAELVAALHLARDLELATARGEELHTRQYVPLAPVVTPARRLFLASTALGGLTTAAAMFMVMMLFVGGGETSARPPAERPGGETLVEPPARKSAVAARAATRPAGEVGDAGRGEPIAAAPLEAGASSVGSATMIGEAALAVAVPESAGAVDVSAGAAGASAAGADSGAVEASAGAVDSIAVGASAGAAEGSADTTETSSSKPETSASQPDASAGKPGASVSKSDASANQPDASKSDASKPDASASKSDTTASKPSASGGTSGKPAPRDPADAKPRPPADPRAADLKMAEKAVARRARDISAACGGKLSVFDDKVTLAATVYVTPAGVVTKATVKPPHAGTNLGRCVEAELMRLSLRAPAAGQQYFPVTVTVKRK